MNYCVYDMEVSIDGWMMAVGVMDSPNSTVTFGYFPRFKRDDRPQLREWLNESGVFEGNGRLMGYNNYNYDDIVFGALLHDDFNAPVEAVYQLSYDIIHIRDYKDPLEQKRFYIKRKEIRDWLKTVMLPTVDIMAILNLRVSLKQIMANLGLPIHELPFDPEKPLPDDIFDVYPGHVGLDAYNVNDVAATEAAYQKMWWVITGRYQIEDAYKDMGLNATQLSDPQIAKFILPRLYSTACGGWIERQADHDYKMRWDISDTLGEFAFNNPDAQALYEQIRDTKDYVYRQKIGGDVRIGETTYRVSAGGMHSADKPRFIVPESGYKLLDVDATSFYPNLAVKFRLAPRHLDERVWLDDVVSGVIRDRTRAKYSGDPVDRGINMGLKIVLNSGVYGALDDKHWGLRDPEMRLATCLNGQMYLLQLIDRIEHAGIRVLSANTDGITVMVPDELYGRMEAILMAYTVEYAIPLEQVEYSKFLATSISDYIAVTADKPHNEVIYDGAKITRNTVKSRRKRKGAFGGYNSLSRQRNVGAIHMAVEHTFLDRPADDDIYKHTRNWIDAHNTKLDYLMVNGAGTAKWEDGDGNEVKGKYAIGYGKNQTEAVEIGRFARVYPSGDNYIYRMHPIDGVVGHIRTMGVTLANDLSVEMPLGVKDYAYTEAVTLINNVLGISTPGKSTTRRNPHLTLDKKWSLEEVVRCIGGYPEGERYRADMPYGEHNGRRHIQLWIEPTGVRLRLFGGGITLTELRKLVTIDLENGVVRDTPEHRFVEQDKIAEYIYNDIHGNYVCTKLKFWSRLGKSFKLMDHKHPNERYKQVPPYLCNEWVNSPFVVIFEGEKDAETGKSLGLPSTCFIYNRAEPHHKQYFSGKSVIIVPDCDEEGDRIATSIGRELANAAKTIFVYRMDDKPKGYDFTDMVNDHKADGVVTLIENITKL